MRGDGDLLKPMEVLKMDTFIPYEKMSKKAKKKYNAQKRRGWGSCSPGSRTEPDKKAYRRHPRHRHSGIMEECICTR